MFSRLECTRVHFVQVSVSVSRPKKGLDNNTVDIDETGLMGGLCRRVCAVYHAAQALAEAAAAVQKPPAPITFVASITAAGTPLVVVVVLIVASLAVTSHPRDDLSANNRTQLFPADYRRPLECSSARPTRSNRLRAIDDHLARPTSYPGSPAARLPPGQRAASATRPPAARAAS